MKLIAIIVVLFSLSVTYYMGAVNGYIRGKTAPAVKLHWMYSI